MKEVSMFIRFMAMLILTGAFIFAIICFREAIKGHIKRAGGACIALGLSICALLFFVALNDYALDPYALDPYGYKLSVDIQHIRYNPTDITYLKENFSLIKRGVANTKDTSLYYEVYEDKEHHYYLLNGIFNDSPGKSMEQQPIIVIEQASMDGEKIKELFINR